MRCTLAFLMAVGAALCSGDKLDNTYLPPKSAQTAGGSGAFLAAPSISSAYKQGGSFGGTGSGFGGRTGGSGFGGRSGSQGAFGGQAFKSGALPSFAGYSQGQQSQGGYSQGGYSQGGFRNPAQDVPILKFNNENSGDGNYAFSYETGNGITAEEVGHAQGDSLAAQGGFAYTSPEGEKISISYTADENGFHPVGSSIPTPPPIPAEILKSIEQNERDAANGIVDDGSYKADFSGSYQGEFGGSSGGAFRGSSGSYKGSSGSFGGQSGSFGGQSGSFGGQSGGFGGQPGSFRGQSGGFGGQSGSFGGQSGSFRGQSGQFGGQPASFGGQFSGSSQYRQQQQVPQRQNFDNSGYHY